MNSEHVFLVIARYGGLNNFWRWKMLLQRKIPASCFNSFELSVEKHWK